MSPLGLGNCLLLFGESVPQLGRKLFGAQGFLDSRGALTPLWRKARRRLFEPFVFQAKKKKEKKKQVWHNQIAANWKLLCKLTEKQPAFHGRQYNKSYRGAIFWYKRALGQLPWFRSIFISPAFFKIEMETRPFFKSNHSENGYFFGV